MIDLRFRQRYIIVMEDLITTEEAAKLLGVTARRVAALITAGRLPARTIGNSRLYLIARADLALVKDRKPGRPVSIKNVKKERK